MPECSDCFKIYSTTSNLQRHRVLAHKASSNEHIRRWCTECGRSHSTYKAFVEHLLKVHGINAEQSERYFEEENEFQEWKREVEERDVATYVLAGTLKKIRRYQCSRSGRTRRNPKTRTRCSRKINAFCPARMIVTTNIDGMVIVEYCFTHFGHEIEATCLPLSESTKQALTALINDGLSVNEILSRINVQTADQQDKKVVTRNDVYNMRRQLRRSVTATSSQQAEQEKD